MKTSDNIYDEKLFVKKYSNFVSDLKGHMGQIPIIPVFTAEEIAVIRMLCEDKFNLEIAKESFLGIRKVERLRSQIFKKMGVKTAAAMAIYAVKYKIYTIPNDDMLI